MLIYLYCFLQADTSDAHYHRLHRFPEILEKRSARLERDRLIHERAKLITELEELRSRSWVYQGAQGGKGEEERKRKIKERELRLKRWVAAVVLSTLSWMTELCSDVAATTFCSRINLANRKCST